jgi:hypothetical protein
MAMPPDHQGAPGAAGVAADPPVAVLGAGARPPARVSWGGSPAYIDDGKPGPGPHAASPTAATIATSA